jgi:dipeptidyl aminopeptidase/acylaminoacyl peptidase
LWRVARSGGAPQQLTGAGEVEGIAFSPRANSLVFAQDTREFDIYRAELTAGGAEVRRPEPVIASTRFDRYPIYSPDGNMIAFATLRSGNWQLWTSDSNGRNTVQLTTFERGEVAQPSWSPDGRQIVFISSAGGTREAYVINATGGKPRKLVALGTDVQGTLWSRDGQWFIFVSGQGAGKVLRAPVAGGTPSLADPEWLFQQGREEERYRARDHAVWTLTEEGKEREVFRFQGTGGVGAASKAGIYFLLNGSVNKPGDLMFYRFPNGPLTKVAGIEGVSQYGFSISPDGRYLLYAKMVSSGSDLMLVENFK